MWRMGMYVMSAVTCAVDHCLNGKKANTEYIEKPFLDGVDTAIENRDERELTEEEKQKLIDEFVLKRKLEKANWDLRHEGR